MSNFFISYLFNNPPFFFSWIVFVVFSISCHEYMHARVALHEGDETAARYGHLTLNPIKQMGITSLIMLLLIGICWGSVPVDPRNFKSKYSNLKVSLAGPLTNLALAILFFCVATLAIIIHKNSPVLDVERSDFLVSMFVNGSVMNLVLFTFNILPIPGFDGWGIIETFVPRELKNSEFTRGASLVILILAIMFCDKLFHFAYIVVDFLLNLFIGM